MASLLLLPFDIHVLIVKYLPLKDCIAYMQVCPVAHDAIYYVFSHRRQLTFESVLDDNQTIALSPQMLMTILYAHTRAETIINFCFNHSFNLYADFSRYFNLYWKRRWVDLDWPYGICYMTVGHPAGNLIFIYYLGSHNGGANLQQSMFLQSLWQHLSDWITPMNHPLSSIGTQPNWCTQDIDNPYTYSSVIDLCSCPACMYPTK